MSAAIEGFELSISGDDVAIADGMIDGSAVEGATLDLSALSLGDGTHDVVYDGSSLTGQLVASFASGDTALGQFTEATIAATAVSLTGRGKDPVVSADE